MIEEKEVVIQNLTSRLKNEQQKSEMHAEESRILVDECQKLNEEVTENEKKVSRNLLMS